MSTALFIGRFQPFHNAHLKVIKNILKKRDEIVMVIGSSQEKNTKENPFSFAERKAMLVSVLKANHIPDYKIIPIPDVYNDKQWVSLIEKKVKQFDVLYTGNPWTIRCFKKYGKKVKRIKLIKGISSTIVRDRLRNGKEWEQLVPFQIYIYIKKIKGEERIQLL